MNLFPNSSGQYPFNLDLATLTQLNQINQFQVGQQQTQLLDEVRQKLNNLNSEELKALMSQEDFAKSFSAYQSGLQEYVLNKFALEYTQTEKGKNDIISVNKTLDINLEYVKAQTQKTQSELAQLAQLLKEQPDLLDKIKNTK